MTRRFSAFLDRESGLHRLHPLTKLSLAGFFLFGAFLVPGIWSAYVLFGAGIVPLAIWGKVLRPMLRAVIPILVPFVISLFVIQGLLYQGGTPIVAIGPVSLKAEGLEVAIRGVGRILVLVSSFLLLSLSTRPDMLMQALTERGLPREIGYVLLTTLQIVPRFQARAAMILDAQQARGLEITGGLPRRLRALVPLVFPLVLSSIVDVEERAIALEARGFSRVGPRTSLLVLTEPRVEVILRWGLLAALGIGALARLLTAA